ncbi:MltR family transcriptional regulator [Celerinatantimonas yamalensis]|uniref:MltR family transcriptional regulator n=1 Tax=Celerinatantimonas yamalensis TaxID=559956 RepID=A0ABW9G9K0_9GAMM
MSTWVDESDILEQLNQCNSIRGFLLQTHQLLERAVAHLIQRVLRKDDYAVKYAVGPLLSSEGPLGEMSVRLKLIYGLGIISQAVYQDIERLISLRNFLNNEAQEYQFTDGVIIKHIQQLHALSDISRSQLEMITHGHIQLDPTSLAISQERQGRVVRSIMTLAIAELCDLLNQDNSLLQPDN